MPHIKHNKGEVGRKLKIREIQNTLDAPSAPSDETTLLMDSHDTTHEEALGCPDFTLLAPLPLSLSPDPPGGSGTGPNGASTTAYVWSRLCAVL